MKRLEGVIRPYAWGSRTALAQLRRQPVPSAEPEAELWLGAHPAAPSVADGVLLPDLVAADPVGVLGTGVVGEFGARLPYLLKLLAAQDPLSLQAHPDADQARAGYAAQAVSRDAGQGVSGEAARAASRNYVDPYHKPEVLVAVSDFEALCGFRDPVASADILARFEVPELASVVSALRTGPPASALRSAVDLVMHWPAGESATLVAAVAAAGQARVHPDAPAFELAARLARHYPGDLGVVLALLLNQVLLRPDEAVFMPAGNLHAYLRGFGVELMAASDNVLRGGLTPKHVDVDELLRVLRYEVLADPVRRGVRLAPGLVSWPTDAREFALVKAVASGVDAVVLPGDGPRIVVCLAGPVRCSAGGASVLLEPGQAAFAAANEEAITVCAGDAYGGGSGGAGSASASSASVSGASVDSAGVGEAVVFQASPAGA